MNWSKKYRGKLEESKPSGPQCNVAQEFGPVATHAFGKFQMNPEDFKEMYRDAREELPFDMPVPRGREQQQMVESSAFSSEFIAMKVCLLKSIQALRYKLRMFGVPIVDNGPAHVFCDNEAVVKNCSKTESVLNKKHSSVAYHMAWWQQLLG
eukprot:scaffold5313_cov35-Cylindrotheca_fusiformis.AAC.1